MRHVVRRLATTARSTANRPIASSRGGTSTRGRGRARGRGVWTGGDRTKNPLRLSAARIRQLDNEEKEESNAPDTEVDLTDQEALLKLALGKDAITSFHIPKPKPQAQAQARRPPTSARGASKPAPARARTSAPRKSSPPASTPAKRVMVGKRGLTVAQLAAISGTRAKSVLSSARSLSDDLRGKRRVTYDTTLSPEDLELVAEHAGLPVKIDLAAPLFESAPAAEGARPVVAVMGHVDHGKTSLLDKLRGGDTASQEAGGITQAIGAFETGDITFIDTPGHAAFAAMRARGATATDVIVLVVAADDGVMPQTLEAIRHAKDAGVAVVVAINKMDVAGADADRVRAQLLENGINTEQTGGEVLCVEVSSKTGLGLDDLLEAITLQAEIVTVPTSNVSKGTKCVCIESNRNRVLGNIATMVVRAGTLNTGDFVLFQDNDARNGELYGRVRILIDVNGKNVKQAGPGRAVGVVGIGTQIPPGSIAIVVPDEKQAKKLSRDIILRNVTVANTLQEAQRIVDERNQQRKGKSPPPDGVQDEEDEDDLESQVKGTLNVVIKGDVQGSADAAANCIRQLATDDYQVRVLATDAGNVTAADLSLAAATAKVKRKTDNALIVAFGVRATPAIMRDAKKQNVSLIQHQLIYHLEDDVRQRVENARSKWHTEEKSLGTAQVLRVFEDGAVGGCSVTEGSIFAGAHAKVWRYPPGENQRICVQQGTLTSLKHFTKDVPNAKKGTQCGVGFDEWDQFQSGDLLECIKLIKGANVE